MTENQLRKEAKKAHFDELKKQVGVKRAKRLLKYMKQEFSRNGDDGFMCLTVTPVSGKNFVTYSGHGEPPEWLVSH